ncbi:MAG: hypothetical protein LW688_02095 [Cryomorphaceae bacterium]|jgi:hypothetical protein|nr:hypothetical protein [Cryomorphaceae bacterium]
MSIQFFKQSKGILKFLLVNLICFSAVSAQSTYLILDKNSRTKELFNEKNHTSLLSKVKFHMERSRYGFGSSVDFKLDSIQGIDQMLIHMEQLPEWAEYENIYGETVFVPVASVLTGEDSVLVDSDTGVETVVVTEVQDVKLSYDLKDIDRIVIIDVDSALQAREKTTLSGRKICFAKKYPGTGKYVITFSLTMNELSRVMNGERCIEQLEKIISRNERKREALLDFNKILSEFLVLGSDLNFFAIPDPHFGVFVFKY